MCENGKSETISFCNSTKGAVDTFHQKCSLQVVIQPLDQKVTSKRVFYGILNAAVANVDI